MVDQLNTGHALTSQGMCKIVLHVSSVMSLPRCVIYLAWYVYDVCFSDIFSETCFFIQLMILSWLIMILIQSQQFLPLVFVLIKQKKFLKRGIMMRRASCLKTKSLTCSLLYCPIIMALLMVNDSLTFNFTPRVNVKESFTIKRAIIIAQYNNKQVKLFVFRQLALRIMIHVLRTFSTWVRTSTNGRNNWLWIKIMIRAMVNRGFCILGSQGQSHEPPHRKGNENILWQTMMVFYLWHKDQSSIWMMMKLQILENFLSCQVSILVGSPLNVQPKT